MIFQVNTTPSFLHMHSLISISTEGDIRRRLSRFRDPEYFKYNLTLVDSLKAIAEKKGTTPARLCIAFVASLGPKVVPMPGSS